MGLSFEKEYAKRKGCAWAALRSLNNVWKSRASTSTKRQLFGALVEPIFTYGLHTWPLTKTRTVMIHGAYSRMLRFALGLPPACISRKVINTEGLYNDLPFLPTQLATRRFGFTAHAARAHLEKRVIHPFIDLVFFEPADKQYPRKKHAPRNTFQSVLLRECRVETVEQLKELMQDRHKARKVQHEIGQQSNDEMLAHVLQRRLKGQLRGYFGLSAKDVCLPKSLPAKRWKSHRIPSRAR
jgi:hypothetical protein